MRLAKEAQVIGCWQWEHFSRCAEKVSKKNLGRDAVVTAGYNGIHSENSYHYRGMAWDLRVWVDMFDPGKGRFSNEKCEEYAESLRFVLGDAFDVIVHYDSTGSYVTHIHVELDLR